MFSTTPNACAACCCYSQHLLSKKSAHKVLCAIVSGMPKNFRSHSLSFVSFSRFSVHFHCRNCDGDVVDVTDAVSALPISILFLYAYGIPKCLVYCYNRICYVRSIRTQQLCCYFYIIIIFFLISWSFRIFHCVLFMFYRYFLYIQFTYFAITDRKIEKKKKKQQRQLQLELRSHCSNQVFWLFHSTSLPHALSLSLLSISTK